MPDPMLGTGLIYEDIRNQERQRIDDGRSKQADLKRQIAACQAVDSLANVAAFQLFIEKVVELEKGSNDALLEEPDPWRARILQGQTLCYRQILAIMRDSNRAQAQLEQRLEAEVKALERIVVKAEDGTERVAPGGV